MLGKKLRILVMAAFFIAAAAGAHCAERLIDQTSTLGGKVSGQKLVVVGEKVKEGQALLQIEGIAGAMPAVRATADGVVAQVLVKPGDKIGGGQVVIRLRVGN